MIKPAQNYVSEIQKKYIERMFDINYQWYYGYPGTEVISIPDNTYDQHCFASVNGIGEVIGVISYSINISSMSCYNFGIMSFDKGNVSFVRDIKQVVDDIFFKYNFNRLEFNCFVGNPALRGYRNFIKKYSGREVGVLRQSNRLMDGKLYDSVLFEILKEEYQETKKPKKIQ